MTVSGDGCPHKSLEFRDHSSIFNLQLPELASSFIPFKRFVPFVFTLPLSQFTFYHVIINHMVMMTWLEQEWHASNGMQGCNEGRGPNYQCVMGRLPRSLLGGSNNCGHLCPKHLWRSVRPAVSWIWRLVAVWTNQHFAVIWWHLVRRLAWLIVVKSRWLLWIMNPFLWLTHSHLYS